MKQLLQLCLFDEPEILETYEDSKLSPEASSLIDACKGLDDWGIEKTMRLSREWIRKEVCMFLGCPPVNNRYNYQKIISAISQ